jgi:uncharacterized repeat protein (TIGR03843 family)
MSEIHQPEAEATNVERVIDLLAHGEMELHGLVPWSSNYTFWAVLHDQEMQAVAIYKPRRGETPLWDFDAGTLCRREVAAYMLSRELGWPAIPPVVLRNGPYGIGSVQLYVKHDEDEHFFTMREQPAYDPLFRRVALFDCVANNADRKGGHLLRGEQGQVWAIDHGLTFHAQYKLRTVIWDYAGQPIEKDCLTGLTELCETLGQDDSPLCQGLSRLIGRDEITAARNRLSRLIRSGVYPEPRPSSRNVPYPLV